MALGLERSLVFIPKKMNLAASRQPRNSLKTVESRKRTRSSSQSSMSSTASSTASCGSGKRHRRRSGVEGSKGYIDFTPFLVKKHTLRYLIVVYVRVFILGFFQIFLLNKK